MTDSTFHSGFVSIIGKPNAGKSTLLNQLLGQKLVIITPKAQTTRHRILGIDNGENFQIIYSDTPGVIRPKYKLHEKMMGFVGDALEDADIMVLIIAADESFPEEDLMEMAKKINIPKVLVVNKIDAVSAEVVAERKKVFEELTDFIGVFEISALEGTNVDTLKQFLISHLPESPPYYDEESVSDRPTRFFAAEMIREQIFLLMHEEIPYSAEVAVIEYKVEPKIIRISAEIFVERATQKGMIIGKGGSMLKKIGTMARKRLEEFTGQKVFLELYVKVKEGWKDNQSQLNQFGYK